MARLGRFSRELRGRFWKPSVDEEVQRELGYHLDMLEEEFRARGLDPAAARQAAREKFGDSARIGDDCRDIGEHRDRERRRTEWLGELRQDTRYAWRQLRGNPRFTLVAVLTLAVGLGAVTTIFGIANAVLLRPLPFAQPDRLVQAWETTPIGQDFAVSEPNYLDWRERTRRLDDIGAYSGRTPSLRTDAGAERLTGAAATHSLFTVLGVAPALGRTFLPEEDVIGGDTRVAVLSHALWQRNFGGDPRVVGKSVELDGIAHRIVGVMPRGFDFPNRSEIWVPLVPTIRYHRDDRRLEAVARLAPGATIEQAGAELSTVARDLAAAYPASNTGWGSRIQPLREAFVTPQLEARVVALLTTVGVLLVMACVNVASLLLARAGAREREIAVRSALGAGRGRIVRQLVVESLVLAIIGGAVGVAVASVAIPVVRGIGGDAIPRLAEMSLDWRVLAFTLAACLTTGVVFGVAPALNLVSWGRRTGGGALALLRGGTRNTSSGGLRNALVVASVALATLLLVCAGLVGSSFAKLMRVDVGFAADQVLTASVALPVSLYPADTGPGRYSRERVVLFHDALIERLEAVPAVRAAAATNIAPFSGENTAMGFEPEGIVNPRPGEYRMASWRVVTPNYFQAMGIPLLSGRVFDGRDRYPAPDVMVINETMARAGWAGQDPIGRQVKLKSGRTMTVVGVVGDTRHLYVDSLPVSTMYFSHALFPWATMWVTVRTSGDPAALAETIRREVRALDPNVAVAQTQPLMRLVHEATAEPRLIVVVFAIFACAALVLATIGLYGIVSYTVSQRSREIGVRLALGAPPRGIVNAVLGQGLRLAITGVVLGSAGAYAASGVLRSILFETNPTDVLMFVVIGTGLIIVAAAASALPARRAARVDPIVTLRSE
jgi:putative ABC transport system permease protein